MKKNLVLSAITALLIAGLLIGTSAAIPTTKMTTINNEKETDIDQDDIISMIANDPEFIKSLNKQDVEQQSMTSKIVKKSQASLEDQTLSMPSQQREIEVHQAPLNDNGHVETIVSTHPALERHGDSAVLGFKWFYFNESDPLNSENYVIWQGTNDIMSEEPTWSDGLLYIDTQTEEPIAFDYPSIHYKGLDDAEDTIYTGTVVGPGNYMSGGPGYLLEVIGDVMINESYSLSSWDWEQHGWHDMIMAENTPANVEGQEWAYGFNSYVHSTTYTNPAIVNGVFIQYPYNNSGYNTISWFSGVEGAQSTDCIVDDNAHIYIEGYGEAVDYTDEDFVYYAAYAVYDPYNTTTEAHGLAIRQFDLDAKYHDEQSLDAWDELWTWSLNSEELSIEYPVVEANDNNLIIMTEIYNDSSTDVELAIWHSSTGSVEEMDIVAWWSMTNGGKIQNADVMHVEGDTFIAHCTLIEDANPDEPVLTVGVSYDGGITWDGWYTWTDDVVIAGNRNVDFAEEGSLSIWQYDASDAEDDIIRLHYSHDTVTYEGNCWYYGIGGEVVDTGEVMVSNLDPEYGLKIGSAPIDETGFFSKILIPGFDVWVNETSPITLRFMAVDGDNSINISEFEITAIDAVNNVGDFVLDVHYRDLKDFPWYAADSEVRDANQMSGAATIQMMLNYLNWNNTLYPEPPMMYDDQQTLFDEFATGDYITGYEMWTGLNAKIDEVEVDYNMGYFFNPAHDVDATEVMRRMCIWLDYPVDHYNDVRTVDVPKLGHPNHVPIAVPVGGDYTHWLAVRGIHTDQNAWIPIPETLEVYGFWVNDPLEDSEHGLPGRSYITVDTWLADYFYELDVPGDTYDGKFLAITDPPNIDGEEIAINTEDMDISYMASPVGMSKFDAKFVDYAYDRSTSPRVKLVANNKIINAATTVVSDVLKYDMVLVEEFANAVATGVTFADGIYTVEFDGTTSFTVQLGSSCQLMSFSYF